VLAVALDVTKPEQVTYAVQQAHERFGSVDVLVNNAGYGYRAAIEEGDDTDNSLDSSSIRSNFSSARSSCHAR
jgi:NAD(P)-dependent dehydrogenase (short-subunit alcohol dehydrogenase family)